VKIPIGKPDITTNEIKAVTQTMKTGWVTQGKKTEQLEHKFAQYCGAKYGIATNTGTAALHIALAAIDIKHGDQIITTPLSCVATTNPILYLNATPIFVDVDPTTLNINPNLIEQKITPKTKAILAVHLFGHPADMDPITEIAEKHNLHIIEDAAQAHGAKYKNKTVGSLGHISCFSFYADKLITTVEGGIALTNDEKLAEKMRLLRSFGMTKNQKFQHPILGYNYKISDIHASIGLTQLQKLDKYIKKRRNNIKYLKEQISNPNLKLPSEQNYAFNVYYVCNILTQKNRNQIVRHLEKQGIETRPLLSFIPDQPPYRKYAPNPNELPKAKQAHQNGFYISNSPQLTQNELQYLATTLTKATHETTTK
jgi:perosamine synthetase